jgi:hypothetical protein
MVAKKTPKRDRPEVGSSGQRIAGRQTLKGTEAQERRLRFKRRCIARDGATLRIDGDPSFARRDQRKRSPAGCDFQPAVQAGR